MKFFSGTCPFGFEKAEDSEFQPENKMQRAIFGKKGLVFPNPNAYKGAVESILAEKDLSEHNKGMKILLHLALLANTISPRENLLRHGLFFYFMQEVQQNVKNVIGIDFSDKAFLLDAYHVRGDAYNRENYKEFIHDYVRMYVRKIYKSYGMGKIDEEGIDKGFMSTANVFNSATMRKFIENREVRPYEKAKENATDSETYYKTMLFWATINRFCLLSRERTKKMNIKKNPMLPVLKIFNGENLFLLESELTELLSVLVEHPIDWEKRYDTEYLLEYIQPYLRLYDIETTISGKIKQFFR